MGSLLLSPEHLHVAVNHLPLVGIAATCVPLIYALVRRERHTLRVGFLMCVIFGASVAAAMFTGDAAQDEIQHGGQLDSLLDAQGREWLHVHEDRADTGAIVLYTTGMSGLVGLLVLGMYPKRALWVGMVSLILCIVSVATMIWVADAGGNIRHPEFRSGIAPSRAAETH